MRTLDGDEPDSYPVYVFNVNEVQIGLASNKAEYIAIWNSDTANVAVGRLGGCFGPFNFMLSLSGALPPPSYVIGDTEGVPMRIHAPQYRYEFN
jgi:hypothetical protein